MKALLTSALLVAVMSAAAPAGAQTPSSATKVYATRADLEDRLAYLDQVLASTVYSDGLKRRAADESQAIRDRLRQGDFRVGDRIFLSVEGEAALSDSFTVAEGPQLRLPVIGDVPVNGILRADLETYLTERLSRFLREPRVRARPLIRLAVDGAVARPGFVTVPADVVLADLLVAAGGATATARTDRMRLIRNTLTLLEGAEIQDALRNGLTVDQVGLQAGDRLVVPQRGAGLSGLEGPVRALSIILTIPLSVIALTQIF